MGREPGGYVRDMRGTSLLITSEGLIAAWTLWMVAAGRPQSTIGLRVYHVGRVLRDLATPPLEVTTDQLVKYLGGQDWKPETRRAYRASLRGFYGWAQATGRIAVNPAAALPPIALPRRVPRPTPEQIYRDALAAADDRARLMIELAAVCGLRRGEIANLRREHVQPDLLGHSLVFSGKGSHERRVPLPELLAAQLLEGPPGWVFPSSSRPGPLTPAHVGKIVSRLLPDGWTCHTLRHRCATVAYAATRDLRAVQELLGHAKPETTALYTQVPQDALRAAVAATAA